MIRQFVPEEGYFGAPVRRVREALGVGQRVGLLVALGVVATVVLLVAIAERMDRLPMVAGIAAALVVFLASVRWPMLPLMAFAALIPIEEVIGAGDFGTVSKFAGILFAVAYGVPRLGRIAVGAMPPAAWAYVGWALLSMGWAISQPTAWGQLQTLLQLFVITILVADVVVHQPTVIRRLMWVYSISAAITGTIGIEAFVTAGDVLGGRGAVTQTQDPAQFAALLLPAFVFGLCEIVNGRRVYLSILVVLSTTGGILVSGTRGAWLGAAVVVLLFILPYLKIERRMVAIGGALILLTVTLQLPGVGEIITSRAVTALDSGGAGRTDIWSVALKIYESNPVLGVGYANFPVAYTPDVVRSADVGAYAAAHPAGSGSHNVVVGTIVELGPIGLLLLFAFIMPLTLNRGAGPDALAVQAALAALMTSALFLDILANRKQLWLMIGLAAGLAALARRRDRPARDVRGRRQLTAIWRPRARRVSAPSPQTRQPRYEPGSGA